MVVRTCMVVSSVRTFLFSLLFVDQAYNSYGKDRITMAANSTLLPHMCMCVASTFTPSFTYNYCHSSSICHNWSNMTDGNCHIDRENYFLLGAKLDIVAISNSQSIRYHTNHRAWILSVSTCNSTDTSKHCREYTGL